MKYPRTDNWCEFPEIDENYLKATAITGRPELITFTAAFIHNAICSKLKWILRLARAKGLSINYKPLYSGCYLALSENWVWHIMFTYTPTRDVYSVRYEMETSSVHNPKGVSFGLGVQGDYLGDHGCKCFNRYNPQEQVTYYLTGPTDPWSNLDMAEMRTRVDQLPKPKKLVNLIFHLNEVLISVGGVSVQGQLWNE